MKLTKLTVLLAVAFSSASAMAQVAPASALLDLLSNANKASMSTTGAASTVKNNPLAASVATPGSGAGTAGGAAGSASNQSGSTGSAGNQSGSAGGALSSTPGFSSGGLMGPSGGSGMSSGSTAGNLFNPASGSGNTTIVENAGPWVTMPSSGGASNVFGSAGGAASDPSSTGFGMADFGKIVTIAAPVLTSLNPKLGQVATIAGGGIAAYNAPNFSVTQLVDGAAVAVNVAALVKPNNANVAMAAQVMGGAAALVTVAGKTSALSGYVNTPLFGSAPVPGANKGLIAVDNGAWSTQPGGPTPISTTADRFNSSQMSAGSEDAAAQRYAYDTANSQAAAEALAVSVSPEGSIGYNPAGNGLQPMVYPSTTTMAVRAPVTSNNFAPTTTVSKAVATQFVVDPSTNPVSFAPTFVPGLTDAQQTWAGQMENSVVQAANSGNGATALALAQQREAGITKANQVNSAAWLQAATSDGAGYVNTPAATPVKPTVSVAFVAPKLVRDSGGND